MKNREIIICDCSLIDHQVGIYEDEDCLIIEPRLNPERNFLQRIRIGIMYIIGCHVQQFGECIIHKDRCKKITDTVQSKVRDIDMMRDRILAEHRKHKNLDWAYLAAAKIWRTLNTETNEN